jgi:hypothetical protein
MDIAMLSARGILMAMFALTLIAFSYNENFSFFISYLLPDKNRSSKQKTAVMKRTTNPQWYVPHASRC